MSEAVFHFKKFDVSNSRSALKVGTDGVLLGAASLFPSSVYPSSSRDCRVLDIGTGTGVVALIMAQRADESGIHADITAIDIDEDAAAEAAGNFAASPWASSLTAKHSSLQDYGNEREFDLIECNPPYFDSSLPAPDRQRNMARHTESLSYREVITFAGDFLAREGCLNLILPKEEETRLIRFASSFGLYPARILNIHTTSEKPPRRIVASFIRDRRTPVREELVMQDAGGCTQAYRDLTGPYYIGF